MRKNIYVRESPKGYHQIISGETLQGWREWDDIFQVKKEKKANKKIYYVTKLSLGIKGEIKTFPANKNWMNLSPLDLH